MAYFLKSFRGFISALFLLMGMWMLPLATHAQGQAVSECQFDCYSATETGSGSTECRVPVISLGQISQVNTCSPQTCNLELCEQVCGQKFPSGRCATYPNLVMEPHGDGCPTPTRRIQNADKVKAPHCAPTAAASSSPIPSGPYDYFAGRTIPGVVNGMIKFILGFVGILALGTFVWGGFLWMTAGGDSKQVTSATSTLRNGLLGFLFVLFSWGILSAFLSTIEGLNALPNTNVQETEQAEPSMTGGASTP